MRLCKDCGKPTGCPSNMRQRCVDCMVIQIKVSSKKCKDKYQYHKQPKHRYATYKRGAIRRGYTFDLTLEEFKLYWNTSCSYCNDTIIGIGLDRIDNSIGYNVNNIAPCCTTCNWMKHKLSHQEFIDKCIQIAKCFTTATM